jgi:hypothetical protein
VLDQPGIDLVCTEASDISSPPEKVLELLAKGCVENGSFLHWPPWRTNIIIDFLEKWGRMESRSRLAIGPVELSLHRK